MRLRDLDGELMLASPDQSLTRAEDGQPANLVRFRCPGCSRTQGRVAHAVIVHFRPTLHGAPLVVTEERSLWTRTGDTLDTLTLAPSVKVYERGGGECWHGYIKHGDAA